MHQITGDFNFNLLDNEKCKVYKNGMKNSYRPYRCKHFCG